MSHTAGAGGPQGLHEDRELVWFTPRKEGRGDKGAQSAQSGTQSAMSLQRLCPALFALSRSKAILNGQGDSPQPVSSRRTSQAQPKHQPWLSLALSGKLGSSPRPGLSCTAGCSARPRAPQRARRGRSGTGGHVPRDGCLPDPLKGNV